jgi:hypothetical protein
VLELASVCCVSIESHLLFRHYPLSAYKLIDGK